MSKLTFLIVVVVLTGCASSNASTSAWRGLHIDGASESAYKESIAAFRQGLPPNARLRLAIALEEIWSTIVARAGAEASAEQTTAIFLAQVDGLGYEQVTRLSGPGAKQRYARVMESPSTLSWMMWAGTGE
jgi:hypothetical protein